MIGIAKVVVNVFMLIAVPNSVKGRRRVLIDYRKHEFQVAILDESWV
jgi:hypothetical protein